MRRDELLACYLDESGDTGLLPNPRSPIQPLLCVLGLTLDLDRLRDFTLEFMALKERFFPGLFSSSSRLEQILKEIKGSDIRSAFRASATDHDLRHHHIAFLDALVDLVEGHQCRIFGRVWIKPIGGPFDGWAIYTSSTQAICSAFVHLLTLQKNIGIMVPDPRLPLQNRRVSFSIFTQKFKVSGDAYSRLVEMPTFGQSENHAGIQVCDLLCSGLLFPIAAFSYCTGHVRNIHVDPGYRTLKDRYGNKIRDLQYRYQDIGSGRWLGGIVVSDPLSRRHGGHLFE